MSGPSIGSLFVIQELNRVKAVNARLLFALQVARTALDAALAPDDRAYCPRCEAVVHTIDDGATCASCKLVLP